MLVLVYVQQFDDVLVIQTIHDHHVVRHTSVKRVVSPRTSTVRAVFPRGHEFDSNIDTIRSTTCPADDPIATSADLFAQYVFRIEFGVDIGSVVILLLRGWINRGPSLLSSWAGLFVERRFNCTAGIMGARNVDVEFMTIVLLVNRCCTILWSLIVNNSCIYHIDDIAYVGPINSILDMRHMCGHS